MTSLTKFSKAFGKNADERTSSNKMTERSKDYLDSQESNIPNGSQDLFDGDHAPIHREESDGNKSDRILLEEILKEQRKLTNKFMELQGQVSALNRALEERKSKFVVQGSTIEGEYVNLLKARFSTNPWFNPQDKKIQDEVTRLLKKEGRSGESGAIQMYSFACTKYTHYRSQVRAKLMSNKEMDVEGLSFKQTHNMLWKHFLPLGIDVFTEERQRITLMLRIFCGRNNLYKGGSCPRFWEDFRSFKHEVREDIRPDKWERMAAKEDRRLARYHAET